MSRVVLASIAALLCAGCFTQGHVLDAYCTRYGDDVEKMSAPCATDDDCCGSQQWFCGPTGADGSGPKVCQRHGDDGGSQQQCAQSSGACGSGGQQCCAGLTCEGGQCCTLGNDCSNGAKCCGNRQCENGACVAPGGADGGGGGGGGGDGGGGTCKDLGQTCFASSECCSAPTLTCDPVNGTCCRAESQACVSSAECCDGFVCSPGFTCEPACGATGKLCSADKECCSGQCLGGHCAMPDQGGDVGGSCVDSTDCNGALVCDSTGACGKPLGGGGTAGIGFGCTLDSKCTSHQCTDQMCEGTSMCGLETYGCADETDCCGALRCTAGACAPPASNGVKNGTCYPTGTFCKPGDACCSGACSSASHTCP